MLIEVSKDILDQAIADKNSSTNDAALFLCEISLAVKRGKHIIYVPSLNGDIDLANNLRSILGRNVVSLLQSSQRDRNKFKSIYDKLNTKAVCSYSIINPDEKWKRVININPSLMVGFEVASETFVVGENLSDTLFFDLTFDYYAHFYKVKKANRCFYPLLGGGDTTCCVYENECKNQKHFCLIITDSDFKLPCKAGEELKTLAEDSTAHKVLEVHNKYKSSLSFFYPMRYVSEIENLIPQKIYEKVGANDKQKIVLSHDYSFYDIKKGLDFCRLRYSDYYTYWKSIYTENVDFSEFDLLSAKHTTFETFKNEAKGKVVLPGWGNDVLKKILDNTELVKVLKQVEQSDLSPSQNKEWMTIGELMFNWTCALEPRYA